MILPFNDVIFGMRRQRNTRGHMINFRWTIPKKTTLSRSSLIFHDWGEKGQFHHGTRGLMSLQPMFSLCILSKQWLKAKLLMFPPLVLCRSSELPFVEKHL